MIMYKNLHEELTRTPIWITLNDEQLWSNEPAPIEVISRETLTTGTPVALLTPRQARHLAHLMMFLATEAEIHNGYVLALRSSKIDEEDVVDIVSTAADTIINERMHR